MTVRAAECFAKAKELQQAGRLEEAVASYSRALELKPDYAEAYNNLGNALRSLRRFDQAIASLRRACDLRPDLAGIHSNLGLALADAGQFEQAVAHHRRAVELGPDLAPAHNNLGLALKELQRLDDAVACYQTAIALAPGFTEAHSNLGGALRALGRPGEAVESYRRALLLSPDYAQAHNNLGNALRDLGQLEDAVASYRRALELKADLVEGHVNLGNALRDLDRFDEALASLRRVVELDPHQAQAHRDLGDVLRALDRPDEAAEAYRRALELRPDDAQAHDELGRALREAGRFDEARGAFERAVALEPTLTSAYRALANGTVIRPGDPLLTSMEALERDGGTLSSDQSSELLFALAKAYGDMDRDDDAFAKLLEANRLRRASMRYDEADARARFELLRQVFTPELLSEKAACGSTSILPIFIVGFPRSGTSLIEQILASHPDVHGAGELSSVARLAADPIPVSGKQVPFPDYLRLLSAEDFRRLGERCVARLRHVAPAALRVTDKLPEHYAFVGFIRLILPNAKIVHVRRDAMDTCVSCFARYFGSDLDYVYDLGELGRRYAMYAELMEHWRKVLPAGAMLEVHYEQIVEGPESQIRRMLDYCGLPWSDRCLAFHETKRAVRTASVMQVRRPIYRSSLQRWRRYEKHLGPLIEALGSAARQ
jgi:tetratricopeptide (TPR) repeat protein